jgi:hypothetical protein
MLLRVNVHARDEDAVDALEIVKPVLAAPRPTPDRVTGALILSFGEHQGHIDRDTSGGKCFQRVQSGGGSRHFDHAVLVPGRPFLAECEVSAHALRAVQPGGFVLDERVQLKTHVPIVPLCPLPGGQEHLLGRLDQFVIEFPGNLVVSKALLDQFSDSAVEAPSPYDLGDDGRI